MLYSGKSDCIQAKVVLLGQSDVFGQSGCIRGKVVLIGARVVVFGQKWLYSGKCGCIRKKLKMFG